MPARIATDPVGDPGRLQALLLGDPSVIESGFRVLDAGLKAGAAGTVDLLGVDRAGQLAIVAVAEGEPEGALRRLLDQYLWARDQYPLLARAHAPQGLSPEPNIRSLLMAESYSFPFLRRLDLLSVEVTPYLAQIVRVRESQVVTVRPALEVFRLPARRVAARVDAMVGTMRESASLDPPPPTPAPDGFPDPVPVFPLSDDPMNPGSFAVDPFFGDVLPGAPIEFGSELVALAPATDPRATTAPAGAPARLDDPFEPLSAEELGEFERFDRMRRERDGRSS